MYTYKSTCRFKMLIYVGSDILEIRPQQVISSEVGIDHPYLKLVTKKKKNKKPTTKKVTKNPEEIIDNG